MMYVLVQNIDGSFALLKFHRNFSCYVYVCIKCDFTGIRGRKNMSDEPVEIFQSVFGKYLQGKTYTVLNETTPSPCINSKQTLLL
jgi:hypothetical protein